MMHVWGGSGEGVTYRISGSPTSFFKKLKKSEVFKHKECRDRRKGFYFTNFPTVFSLKRKFLLGFASSDTSFHMKVYGAGPSNWEWRKATMKLHFFGIQLFFS